MKNVVALRTSMGPRESTPELRAALRKASIKAVQDRLAEHSRISAKTWIYVGKELIGTKENANRDGPKVFASLFAKNKEHRDDKHYPFSLTTARYLISIAQHLPKPPGLPGAKRNLRRKRRRKRPRKAGHTKPP